MNEIVELANLYDAGVKGYNRMNGSIISADGISGTIRANSGGHNEVKILEPSGIYVGVTPAFQRGPLKGVSRTVKAVQHDAAVVQNGPTIRKLTPLECWRLMGFDDADHERAKNVGVSNSQRYKQVGNSIVVNVLEAIFKQMI